MTNTQPVYTQLASSPHRIYTQMRKMVNPSQVLMAVLGLAVVLLAVKNSKLNQQLDDSTNQHSITKKDMQGELAKELERYQVLRNELTNTDRTLADLRTKLQNTEVQLGDTEAQLVNSANALSDTKDLLQKSTTELEVKISEADDLQDQNLNLQHEQAQTRAEMLTVEEDLKQLSTQLLELRTIQSTTQDKLAACEVMGQQLQVDSDRLRGTLTANEALTQENEHLKEEVQNLQKLNSENAAKVLAVEEHLEQLQSGVKLEETVEKVEEKNEIMEGKNETVEEKNEMVEEKIEKVEEKIEKVEEKKAAMENGEVVKGNEVYDMLNEEEEKQVAKAQEGGSLDDDNPGGEDIAEGEDAAAAAEDAKAEAPNEENGDADEGNDNADDGGAEAEQEEEAGDNDDEEEEEEEAGDKGEEEANGGNDHDDYDNLDQGLELALDESAMKSSFAEPLDVGLGPSV